MKKRIDSRQAPKAAGPYSQAVESNGLVFTSGQVYLTKEGVLLDASIEEQTRQVMSNLNAILKEAGCTFQDVVKTTIYVTDLSFYGKINEVYGSYFSEPFPARETVSVKELPLGARLEISMIAVKK